jgi:hypothetical protein
MLRCRLYARRFRKIPVTMKQSLPTNSALVANRAVFGFKIGSRDEEHIVATDAHAVNQRDIRGRGRVVRI